MSYVVSPTLTDFTELVFLLQTGIETDLGFSLDSQFSIRIAYT